MLHDLRLFDGQHHFQIDTLIITSKVIFIIEVKNISGTVIFDSAYNQLISELKMEKKRRFLIL
ncbi:nuclease-related domain-containing protein [Bacillus pakistanensis]|uniref:nuclease-related domain-containing protein n=1 Tax=Rossellomorea pakistanensis TaxID=992288 RepID=UPI00196278A1